MDLLRKLICAVVGHDWQRLGVYFDDIELAGRPLSTTASGDAVFEKVRCRCCGALQDQFVTWGSTRDPDTMAFLESRTEDF